MCIFDQDYFEDGVQKGISCYEHYHWMPQRSFREALAYIDYLKLDKDSCVLEFGCSKGFLIRALRELEIRADGCDISKYALSFAPGGCWDCGEEPWGLYRNFYTHIICKDVFEHLNPKQLAETLRNLANLAPTMMCIVPIGDNGKYRIPEYHKDVTHYIAEDEVWWTCMFSYNGWKVMQHCKHVPGIKDNWMDVPGGNHVFLLEKK
jgi:hypothetical protein